MQPLQSRPLFTLSMTLHPILDLGTTPAGHRRVVPVASGRFSGERLRGEVLPHTGSDLLLMRTDGSFQQDVRMMLRTDDGALILMTYRGVRHSSQEIGARLARGEVVPASSYYLRTAPAFETGSPDYAWLNHVLAIGVGERLAQGVSYAVFEIL